MTYSEASKASTYKYKAKNIKRVPFDVQNAEYEEIKSAAAAAGESVNGYIKKAIRQRIESEK